MDDPIAEIKGRVGIEDLVGRAGLTVVGRGRVRTTQEHDSLKLWPEWGRWRWYSRGLGGDVFDWWMLEHRCDFRTALEELARLAGVELRPLTAERREQIDRERQGRQVLELAAAHYARVLAHHPGASAARDYCHGRGWTDATLAAARVGYVVPSAALADARSAQDAYVPLAEQLRAAGLLEHPLAKAVLSIPADHIVYPHSEAGQVVYLSGRSISGKRHYNLPGELAGGKRVYRTDWLTGRAETGHSEAVTPVTAGAEGITVLVEGQADALSLAQLGYRAVALCGVSFDSAQDAAGQGEAGWQGEISHVGLDNDAAGQRRALEIAWQLNPLVQVVGWPERVTSSQVAGAQVGRCKDANDLLRAGLSAEELGEVLNGGTPALLLRAELARKGEREVRNAHIEAVGQAWRGLDELTQADLGPELARAMGVGLGQFKRLMSAAEEKAKAVEAAEGQGEKPSPESYETSAGAVVGGVIFEQCVRWDEAGVPSAYFAVRTADGEIKTQPVVDAGGTSYVPYPAKIALIKRQVILFPSEPAEYGSQKALLNDIRAFIHRWLDVDTFYEQLASYYVMFTWLYDMFETLPYLRALGDYGTGKTRFIQAIGAICYRPMFVSGASTASPIFRTIDMFRGTLVIDEADFAKSDAAVEIIKIVNVGYSRGGVVLRAEKDEESDSYYPSAKDVFGPKILATRKLFEDRATESRCLTKRMTTARPRPGIPRMLNRGFWADALALRNKLLLYRLRNWRIMEVNENLSDASIEPRLDQVTLALKTLVDDPEMLQQINHFVRAYNATLITDRQMSVPAIVVQVLANTWFKPEQTLQGPRRDFTMKTLAERVQDLLNELDPDERVSPRRLGSLLSADLGLTKRAKDPDTRRDTVLVEEAELLALMGRYGIDIPERES